ncbi:L,D-transpeptidase family protein [Citromicrobium bathyomarinum]|uniref:L,D-transpeptidase family protein n=1 Tax=Citromicrobium bathyomarinum TaxID=72174 RepID=UPI00315B02C6
MVKGFFTILCLGLVLGAAFLLFMPEGSASDRAARVIADENIVFVSQPVVQEVPPSPVPAATATKVGGATLPPSADAVLRSGVLIVISKGSQQMYVFKDGDLWDSSPVSTGKPGKETPSGVFPILQKRVHHRSNIYSNAPMPHMQRLTWDGIAIHAGRLPGYAASHGCIRLPKDFARSLYQLTGKDTTTVVVVDQPLAVAGQARRMALAMPTPRPGERGHLVQRAEPRLADLGMPAADEPSFAEPQPQVAQAEPAPRETARPVTAESAEPSAAPVDLLEQTNKPVRGQTIQLAAKGSFDEAEAYWSRITTRFPELEGYQKTITPAVVRSKQYYRLRATGPDARAVCSTMKQSGADCFPVS